MTMLSVLMPVFDERATVEQAIERVLGAELPVKEVELIVVDDGSKDGSRERLRQLAEQGHFRLLLHDRNRGKGAAVRTALAAASGTLTTIMDADLEYDPGDLRALLDPMLADGAKAVYGVRGFGSDSAYSFWYVVGNKAVTLATNVLYTARLSDLMTCQKVLSTELFRSLRLEEAGFAIEAEITARLLRKGVPIFEVPITYRARRRDEGKKLTAVDGLRVLRTLVRCRVGRRDSRSDH